MTIEEKIKEAMARYVERQLDIKDVTVISWDESFSPADPDGTCEYCGGEDSYDVTINFSAPDSGKSYFMFDGSFAELIRELD
jgi:hypothetical protein